ncbi:adenylate kinase 8-like [Centruroides sculpturatus]|uniref:adenylate kinase 8-like n=1 Tax=Centruroides sculpturatus TaxID=218467 RepID=UPI000C6E0CBF|nr:adenylate kinase 8-like [Centruroides sculpturatus]
MDATQRPVVFPPEFERYAEKHNIFQTFQLYLERLILERPEDPLKFLHKLLTSSISDAPKIIVFGPPTKQRRLLCKELCNILNVEHITLELLEENANKIEASEQIVPKDKHARRVKIKKMISPPRHKLKKVHLSFFKTDEADTSTEIIETSQEIPAESKILIEEEESEKCYARSKLNDEIEAEEDINLEKNLESVVEAKTELEEQEINEEEIKIDVKEKLLLLQDDEDIEETTELQDEAENVEEEQKIDNGNVGIDVEMEDEKEMNLLDEDKDQLQEESETWIEEDTKYELDLEESEILDADLDKHEEIIGVLPETDSCNKEFVKEKYLNTEKSNYFESFTKISQHKIKSDDDKYSLSDKEITLKERSKLVIELMKQIETRACREHGWLIEGFPTTRSEAKTLQQWAVFPNHVVVLNCPSDFNERISENSIINNREWLFYREEFTGLLDCYKNYYCRNFRLDQSLQILSNNILKFISSQPISNTPFTPRILLLGLPGCGKTTQAMLLSERYDVVNVDMRDLIYQTINREIPLGESLRYCLQNNLPIIDHLKAEAIARRMSLRDVLVRGYVLHGFPDTFEQMLELNKVMEYRMPNRVIVIDVSENTSCDRFIHRRFDPINHKFYHLSNPPSTDIQLLQRPENGYDFIKKRIQTYRNNIEKLENFFRGFVIHIDGEMNIENVSEAILSAIIHPLPKSHHSQISTCKIFNMERLCKGFNCDLTL